MCRNIKTLSNYILNLALRDGARGEPPAPPQGEEFKGGVSKRETDIPGTHV